MEESLNISESKDERSHVDSEGRRDIDLIEENVQAEKGSADDPFMMNGLTLAYIGDAVFELMVRKYMIANGSRQVDKLHKHTISVVNAKSQSDMINAVMDELTDRETAIFKRGRNSSTVTAAKHQSINDYRRATGFEALYGYLYLSGDQKRLDEIFNKCMEAHFHCN